MWKTALGRVRMIGMMEGVSYLTLLLIAMPLKYLAGQPGAVLVVGWIHGVLFMLYAVMAVLAFLTNALPLKLLAAAALASILPGGPFVLDPFLKRCECPQPQNELGGVAVENTPPQVH